MFNISGMSVLVPVFLIPLGFILNPFWKGFRMETRGSRVSTEHIDF